MSRFYSFYELLNFWTLNYELGDDLHKTRWQGANIKSHPIVQVHACIWIPWICVCVRSLLLSVFTAVCMCADACFHFVCVWECRWGHTYDSDRVRGWLLGFTSLKLVHYSLTVIRSEIPGSGCVTQTHTQTIGTHLYRTMHTHTFDSRLNIIVFLVSLWAASSDVSCPRGRERGRKRGSAITLGILNETIVNIFYCNSPCKCVADAYAHSLFCTPIPRWHLRSLPSTLSGSTPFSFFRHWVSEFFGDMLHEVIQWGGNDTKKKNVPKNKLLTVYLSLL